MTAKTERLVQCCRADKCDNKHCEHHEPHKPCSTTNGTCTETGACGWIDHRVRCVYVKEDKQ